MPGMARHFNTAALRELQSTPIDFGFSQHQHRLVLFVLLVLSPVQDKVMVWTQMPS